MASTLPSASPAPRVVLEATELARTYQTGEVEVRALRGVSLRVEQGDFVAIMGPSGSGKSTMMNILGCLDRPTSGSYQIDNLEVSSMSGDELAQVRNRKIGFVFQGFNLLARTSAIENVELPLLYRSGLSAHERYERSRRALEAVGLGRRLDHVPTQLSGGEQQRVAIARALVNEPTILLADEPTGNLDSKTSVEVMRILQELNESKHLTILLVTHEPDIAQYARRFVRFKDGRIVEDTQVVDRLRAEAVLASLRADEPAHEAQP
jgi:putative ABC transport system ATP-binding protein